MINKIKSVQNILPKHPLLNFILFLMGLLVIAFNVMGYDILFHDEPWLGIASPFGILLGCTEIAVLLWTSAVIKNWCNVSRILKIIILVLVPSFAFLCYSGINSYLTSLATAEIRKVQEVQTRNANDDKYIESVINEKLTIETQLSKLSTESDTLNSKINNINEQINARNEAASARRLKASNCSLVPDCAASVKAFETQAKLLQNELPSLYSSREQNNKRSNKLVDQLDLILGEIKEQKRTSTQSMNQFAGTQSSFNMKKKAYEDIILSISSWFNWVPKDPFNVFIGFVSFLIYPVYFILNLFLALNSEGNVAARNARKTKRLENKSLRQATLNKIINYQRIKVAIVRRSALTKKTHRNLLYKKTIKYFRVWASRRTKLVVTEVEKIIEVEKKVEVIVEKIKEVELRIEVPVEVERIVEIRVEVPIEVDRIVKVPTEIPIYIEKIQKIPEPVFIKEPQIIIHERIIPVPENITGEKLEELLNAQPRLNEDVRTAEREATLTNAC